MRGSPRVTHGLSASQAAKPLQPGPSKGPWCPASIGKAGIPAPYLPDEDPAHAPVIPAEGGEHLRVPRVSTAAVARARAWSRSQRGQVPAPSSLPGCTNLAPGIAWEPHIPRFSHCLAGMPPAPTSSHPIRTISESRGETMLCTVRMRGLTPAYGDIGSPMGIRGLLSDPCSAFTQY